MRIFGFDLLPYPEHLDHLKVDGELPYPLSRKHFRPEVAVRNYREHLDAWALNVLLLQFNQGAMPHEMFVNQIRRFAEDVMPAVQRHRVTAVPGA